MLPLLLLLIASAAPSAQIIRDVAVVDVAAGRIEPHRDIVIRGARIEAVRPAAVRAKTTRYAIPGLWDMDAHLTRARLPLLVKNGVTGVRDMSTDLHQVRAWEAEIAHGAILGPRIYASGLPLSGELTPAAARAAFLRAYDAKADFVSVDRLSAKAFEALAEMSRHDGLPFAGLPPAGMSAVAAAEDRIVSIERPEPPLDAAAFDLFRRYGVRQTPELASRPRDPALNAMVCAMAKAGVPILAGSGSADLRDELEALVQAGLTPAQALRAATLEPARLMHRERELGEIRAGFDADLVILNADPLADIANVRRVEEVMITSPAKSSSRRVFP
jgi:imidazolonepropionase-like amidohydrolase